MSAGDGLSTCSTERAQRVDICVFTITDDRLSDAIVAAHRRGVAVTNSYR